MHQVVAEELNGFKINIDQEGTGRDQIQAFQNIDRNNQLDYRLSGIPCYNRTEGYKERLKRHNQWLLKKDNL